MKLDLRKDELNELAKGGKTAQRTSMTGFLTMGLELENDQYVFPCGWFPDDD